MGRRGGIREGVCIGCVTRVIEKGYDKGVATAARMRAHLGVWVEVGFERVC